ncbi:MAG TPA: hypothetical protein DCS63_10895 [Elusimicrobia bacterium]|nr:hypothetical protein [Elusimicrobiota bacterium]
MTADLTKLLHDLKSKCASLKSAADLYKDCSAGEKKEMLALMTAAADEIAKTVQALGKTA